MSKVHVVHCIDTEGPLYESLSATFERIKQLFGADLRPSRETLRKIQNREIPLNGREDDAARVFSPAMLAYNDTWDKMETMLRRLMAPEFRHRVPDSEGGGWVFNWFCVDHVGYAENPRRRDLGFHNIFDFYRDLMAETEATRDGLHFHHHPFPHNRRANSCATHWFAASGVLYEILARRVIDRLWFPSSFRPGFHTERPDSHLFLEQFIPFDYANQACEDDGGAFSDLGGGRYGDWRRATTSWHPYQPSHDDYQVPGGCRRWIFRCLNMGMRVRVLTQAEVDRAFAEARDGRPVVLAFANHDHRDMTPDIVGVQDMLLDAQRRFPGIPFVYSEARSAARAALGLTQEPPLSLDMRLDGNRVVVTANRPTFGPQPFLALRTRAGTYHHDAFDFDTPHRRWSYTLDDQTFPLDALSHVGAASCDKAGNVAVARLDLSTGTMERATL